MKVIAMKMREVQSFFWLAIELSILLEVDTYDNDDGKDWNDVLIFGICAEIFFFRGKVTDTMSLLFILFGYYTCAHAL